jgi:DNA helicase-2/ATP-dependent DNA helicase PcrA
LSKLFEDLNENQRQAVQHIEGASMIIAGAGSGKTRVLTYRIAYMISQGINPFHILSLTFTNKAAKEMKDRVMNLLGNAMAHNVWMGTFHSIFNKILHIESNYLGFTSRFLVYDTTDAKNVIKSILKEKKLDDKQYRPGMVCAMISNAKANLISAEEYTQNNLIAADNKAKRLDYLGEIYMAYQHRLRRADSMDFDDLLFNMYILLRDFPEMLYKYQHKFKYILVDEYQDTNYVQYQIIKKLAALHENICVVGDDAQSIYAFRGANIQNILNFKDDYPDHKLFKLEQNYRSTKNIIQAANTVIKNNQKQIHKVIWTSNDEGEKIKLVCTLNETEEAQKVVESVLKNKERYHLNYSDFTLLYRTNAQSRPFEEVLRRHAIPYRIFGGMSFYQRKEIKDVLAYYRLSVNHKDDEALRRIINYPARGIGLTSMEKIMATADQRACSLWDIIENLPAFQLNINQGIQHKIEEFVQKIKSYHSLLETKNAFELGKYIADTSGITQELRQQEEDKERYENLGELFNAMKDFTEKKPENEIDMETGEDLQNYYPSLDRFLHEVVLYTDADEEDKDDDNKVKLMTVHAAKGLEFPYVYLVGMEDNLFPSYMVSSQEEFEEERRLFYVAITRAKQCLTISYAQSRFMFGNVNFSRPSSFLYEIDKQVLDQSAVLNQSLFFGDKQPVTPITTPKKILPKPIAQKSGSQLPKQSSEHLNLGKEINHIHELKPGLKVFHDKFGIGEVMEIIDDKVNSKTIIQFDQFGKKTMLLRFAKLKTIL